MQVTPYTFTDSKGRTHHFRAAHRQRYQGGRGYVNVAYVWLNPRNEYTTKNADRVVSETEWNRYKREGRIEKGHLTTELQPA